MTKITRTPKQDLKRSGIRSKDHYNKMEVARSVSAGKAKVSLPKLSFLEGKEKK